MFLIIPNSLTILSTISRMFALLSDVITIILTIIILCIFHYLKIDGNYHYNKFFFFACQNCSFNLEISLILNDT